MSERGSVDPGGSLLPSARPLGAHWFGESGGEGERRSESAYLVKVRARVRVRVRARARVRVSLNPTRYVRVGVPIGPILGQRTRRRRSRPLPPLAMLLLQALLLELHGTEG